MSTYTSMGWFLGFLFGYRIYKALRPFKVRDDDVSRFAVVGRLYRIYSFTGRAHDVSKGSTMSVSGRVDIREGTGHGSISSKTTIHDQLFLTDASGREHSCQLSDFNVAVAEGHQASVAWAIHKGKKTGKYVLCANHSTGQNYFNDKQLYKIAAGNSILGNLQVFISVFFITALPLMLLWALVIRLQVRRFKKSGVMPLVKALEARAQELPQQRAATQTAALQIDDLDRLATLAREGLLTDEEWVRAKELFIGKRPDAKAQALGHLRQIYQLFKEGALSESEFNSKKWEILTRESHAY